MADYFANDIIVNIIFQGELAINFLWICLCWFLLVIRFPYYISAALTTKQLLTFTTLRLLLITSLSLSFIPYHNQPSWGACSKDQGFQNSSSVDNKTYFNIEGNPLTLSWRRPLSCRNQSIDLLGKFLPWYQQPICL